MTENDSGYLLRPDAEEIRRLHAQAHFLDRSTNPLITRYVRPGMNCLELGCGLGSSTQMIAETIGKTGRLTALDQSQVYLDYTRTRLEYSGDEGALFVQATVETYDFPDDLDFVFGRAVLHHVHDAAAAYKRVASAIRPGGLVVFQEPDIRGIFDDHITDAQRQLWTWYMAMGKAAGVDFGVGDALARMATGNGLTILEVAAFQPYLATPTEKETYPELLHTIASQIVDGGLASREEVDACATSLQKDAASEGAHPYVTFVHCVAMKPFHHAGAASR